MNQKENCSLKDLDFHRSRYLKDKLNQGLQLSTKDKYEIKNRYIRSIQLQN